MDRRVSQMTTAPNSNSTMQELHEMIDFLFVQLKLQIISNDYMIKHPPQTRLYP